MKRSVVDLCGLPSDPAGREPDTDIKGAETFWAAISEQRGAPAGKGKGKKDLAKKDGTKRLQPAITGTAHARL